MADTLPANTQPDIASLLATLKASAGQTGSEAMASATLASQIAALQANRQIDENTRLATASTAIAAKSLSETAMELLDSQMTALNPGWKKLVSTTAAATQRSVDEISMFLASTAPAMLQSGADLATQQGSIAKSLMSGELPEDMQRMITTRAAEKGGAVGLFGNAEGGAARNLELRDLGLGSLQAMTLGASMAEKTSGIWSSGALAVASVTASQQVLAKQQTDMIATLKPNIDVGAIFDRELTGRNAGSVVSADTVFQSSMKQYNDSLGWGVQVYGIEKEAQSQYDSMMLQYRTDLQNSANILAAAYNAAASNERVAQIGYQGQIAAGQMGLRGAAIQASATRAAAQTSANAMLGAAKISASASASKGGFGSYVF
jgi:hypothetical protein